MITNLFLTRLHMRHLPKRIPGIPTMPNIGAVGTMPGSAIVGIAAIAGIVWTEIHSFSSGLERLK